MKKGLFISVILIVALFSSCATSSGTTVSRVDANTKVDLSGRWNDVDVRLVCESLINDCLSSPRVSQFIREYSSGNRGRLPAVMGESGGHILDISSILNSNAARKDVPTPSPVPETPHAEEPQ